MQSSFKRRFQLIPKVVRLKTGEVLYEKVSMSPRPPPKISLQHEWTREFGSEHAQRAEVGQLSKNFQSNQPTLNPIRGRSGQPVVCRDENHERPTVVFSEQASHRRFSRESQNLISEDVNHDGTVKSVVETRTTQTRSSDDSKDHHVEDKTAHDRTG